MTRPERVPLGPSVRSEDAARFVFDLLAAARDVLQTTRVTVHHLQRTTEAIFREAAPVPDHA